MVCDTNNHKFVNLLETVVTFFRAMLSGVSSGLDEPNLVVQLSVALLGLCDERFSHGIETKSIHRSGGKSLLLCKRYNILCYLKIMKIIIFGHSCHCLSLSPAVS